MRSAKYKMRVASLPGGAKYGLLFSDHDRRRSSMQLPKNFAGKLMDRNTEFLKLLWNRGFQFDCKDRYTLRMRGKDQRDHGYMNSTVVRKKGVIGYHFGFQPFRSGTDHARATSKTHEQRRGARTCLALTSGRARAGKTPGCSSSGFLTTTALPVRQLPLCRKGLLPPREVSAAELPPIGRVDCPLHRI